MRAPSPVVAPFVIFAAAVLIACQDSSASDAERDTHMGDIHAAMAASSAPQSPFGALPPPTPGAGPEMAVPPVAVTVSDAGRAKDASARPAHVRAMP